MVDVDDEQRAAVGAGLSAGSCPESVDERGEDCAVEAVGQMIRRGDAVQLEAQAGKLALTKRGERDERRSDRRRDDHGANDAGPDERQAGRSKEQIVEDQRAGDAAGRDEDRAGSRREQAVRCGFARVA